MDFPVEVTVHYDFPPPVRHSEKSSDHKASVGRTWAVIRCVSRGHFWNLNLRRPLWRSFKSPKPKWHHTILYLTNSKDVLQRNFQTLYWNKTNRSCLESQTKWASPSSPTFCSFLVSGFFSSNLSCQREFIFLQHLAKVDHSGQEKSSVLSRQMCLQRASWLQTLLVFWTATTFDVEVCPVGAGYIITLWGKSATVCVMKLQIPMDDLDKSLQTQEVPPKDSNPEGKCLL